VTRYILMRLATMVPVLLLVSSVTFIIIDLLPGDPAMAWLGPDLAKDQQMYERMKAELGLNQPLWKQYFDWIVRTAHGDLGTSIRNHQPVTQALFERLLPTVELSVLGMLIGLLIAIPIGIVSAVRPNSLFDNVGTLFALGGVAMPPFWLGILLILTFGVWLRVLPPSGYVPPTEDLVANLRLMLMPALTLGVGLAAVMMRQVRSSLIEVLAIEYITTARAKGLRDRATLWRHALPNALIPVVTMIGLQTGRLFAGAVVVETIFSIPGLGRLAVDSIFFHDFPMVQGVVLVLAVGVLLSNLLTDLAYGYLDPRIRLSGG
jgi:peptide/nickel transport system permease protein